MRVTEKIMANSVTSNLFVKTEQIYRAQQTVSTGKRVSRPSDDPTGMGKVLDCRKTIASIDQYSKNIIRGRSQLQLTEATLGSVDNQLIRAKELAVFQSTETCGPETRAIAAEEVRTIRDQILQLANTKLGNSYIFSGHKTTTTPFPEEGNPNFEFKGDSGKVNIIVGENVEVCINANGGDVFAGAADLFGILTDLEEGLMNNDTAGISEQIELLDDAMNQVLEARAEIGEKLNVLDASESYWAQFKVNTEQLLLETEDVDITKAIIDLTALESAYEASLSVAANIIQPSLLDFLR
jgi:flagellar hook-associated protein 3 FlgL